MKLNIVDDAIGVPTELDGSAVTVYLPEMVNIQFGGRVSGDEVWLLLFNAKLSRRRVQHTPGNDASDR